MSPRDEHERLRLDIVGAGPAYSDRIGSVGAAYLVRSGSTAILFDLGQGAFPRLASLIDPATLDIVLISHLHPDHFVDLVSFRHYLRWGPGHPRRARIAGPAGLAERLDALHAEPGFAAAALDIETLAPGVLTVGSMSIEIAPVTHAAPSFGFRIATRDGVGLVYSGDCGRADDLAPLIHRGDTLLAEVSFGPGPVSPTASHLDGPTVGSLARRSGVGRLLLTHLLMGFDESDTVQSAADAFGDRVRLVQPGDWVVID